MHLFPSDDENENEAPRQSPSAHQQGCLGQPAATPAEDEVSAFSTRLKGVELSPEASLLGDDVPLSPLQPCTTRPLDTDDQPRRQTRLRDEGSFGYPTPADAERNALIRAEMEQQQEQPSGWLSDVRSMLRPSERAQRVARDVIGDHLDSFVISEASDQVSAYLLLQVPIFAMDQLPSAPTSRCLPHDEPSLVRVSETDDELQRFASGRVRIGFVADYLLDAETPQHDPSRRMMDKLVGGMLLMDHEVDARQYARLVREMPPVYCRDTRSVYQQGDAYVGRDETTPWRWLRSTPVRTGESSGMGIQSDTDDEGDCARPRRSATRSRRGRGRGRGRGGVGGEAGDGPEPEAVVTEADGGRTGGEAGDGPEPEAEAVTEADGGGMGGEAGESEPEAAVPTDGEAGWKADFLTRLVHGLVAWRGGGDDASVPKSMRGYLRRGGYAVIGTTPGWYAAASV